MALWKRGPNGIWYYGFAFAGRYYQGSSYSKSKTMARDAMLARRRELEKGIQRSCPPGTCLIVKSSGRTLAGNEKYQRKSHV